MGSLRIILFDIDRTLFNIDKFKKLTINSLGKILNTSPKNIKVVLKEYIDSLESSTDFNPKDYCQKLANKFNGNYDDLIRIFFGLRDNYLKSKFKDSEAGLKKLSGNYCLGIFSQGGKEYQIQKLKEIGLLKYFDDQYIFILRRKTELNSILKLPINSVIVDDNNEVIDQLIKHDLKPILIDRSKKIKQNNYLVVHDLRNLKALLEIGNRIGR